jgi:CRP-like cAMP-binding protein
MDRLFIMGRKYAHQRIAYFLLDMHERIGHEEGRFNLPMSRQDVSDYLGMSIETASRGFSNLKKKGLIEVKKNYQVCILDFERLKAFSEK